MSLFQKKTCVGCRIRNFSPVADGQKCRAGFLVDGIIPLEPCPKPKTWAECDAVLKERRDYFFGRINA